MGRRRKVPASSYTHNGRAWLAWFFVVRMICCGGGRYAGLPSLLELGHNGGGGVALFALPSSLSSLEATASLSPTLAEHRLERGPRHLHHHWHRHCRPSYSRKKKQLHLPYSDAAAVEEAKVPEATLPVLRCPGGSSAVRVLMSCTDAAVAPLPAARPVSAKARPWPGNPPGKGHLPLPHFVRLPLAGAASSCNSIATRPTQETFPLGIGGITGLVLLAGVSLSCCCRHGMTAMVMSSLVAAGF